MKRPYLVRLERQSIYMKNFRGIFIQLRFEWKKLGRWFKKK